VRRALTVPAVLVALALVLAACPAATPNGNGRVPGLEARPGGTLVVAVRDLGSFDPADASGRGALIAVANVFESLTRVNPHTLGIEPAAARRWTVSKDGLVWRFRLADRRWHDGRRVTARDFEFAFDRITRRETRSDNAFQLEQVEGFTASKDAGDARTLAGVRVRGRDVLIIRLRRPFNELPWMLSHPAMAPLPRHLYVQRNERLEQRAARRLERKPVGNGPFRVRRFGPDGALLTRFDGYRPEPALLDAIDLKLVSSSDEGWEAFLKGDVDVTDVPPSAVHDGSSLFGDEGFTPFWATLSFALNLERATYRKPLVRRAISLAIDRKAIARDVYGNTRDPATGIIARGVRGFSADACGVCTFDPARARQIIKAAFPARKPSITVDFLSEPGGSTQLVARAIANDLTDVGFRARMKGHSERAYRALLDEDRQDMAMVGWLPDVPTPDGFLSGQLRSEARDNHAHYSDATFDRLLDRARRTRDGAQRLRSYRQAERRVLGRMPLIPILFFRNRAVIADRVHDLFLDGAGLFEGERVWLAA